LRALIFLPVWRCFINSSYIVSSVMNIPKSIINKWLCLNQATKIVPDRGQMPPKLLEYISKIYALTDYRICLILIIIVRIVQ